MGDAVIAGHPPLAESQPVSPAQPGQPGPLAE